MKSLKGLPTIPSCVIAVVASPASPENALADQNAAAPSTDRAPSADPDADRNIVVSDSRIARCDDASDSPITTMNETQLKSTAARMVEEPLRQMPQFAVSAGTASGGVSTTRASQASANLRALCPQRTLVLLDGRRMQPTGVRGVDLSTIPDALEQRVFVNVQAK